MSLAAVDLTTRDDQISWVEADAQFQRWKVLLLPPNLVCHLRLLLALAGATANANAQRGSVAVGLFAASIALDAADGWLARHLNCCTRFGAFYDVLVDNVTRALLWCGAAAAGSVPGGGGGGGSSGLGPWAGLPIALEGITLACTHAGGGADWKTGCFRDAPHWVQAVMRDGFHSPAGALAIAGLSGCPLWLYARSSLPPGSLTAADGWGLLLVPGRLLAAAVECWLVQRRVQQLLLEDTADQLRRNMS